MKHLSRFFGAAVVAAMTCVPIDGWAQSWTSEAPAAGTFYLYNVGAGKFLNAGNSWGTQAEFDAAGLDLTLVASGSGFTINTGMARTSVYTYLGMNGYCDGASAVWTFTEQTDGSYTMTSGTATLGYDGSTSIVSTNASGDNAKWKLLSKQDRINGLSSATATSGVDATFYIICPDFGKYDTRFSSSWQGSPNRNGGGTQYISNYNSEKYNTTFDVYQTLSSVPNGVYTLTCQGFYRDGDYAVAAPLHTAGTEALNALLYANEKTSSLVSIFDAVGKNSTVGVNSTLGYIPNSQSDASSYFTAGLYTGNSVKVVVTDGTLKVGVKKTVAVTSDWTVFDKFRLTYYGVDLTALKTAIEEKISTANGLTDPMNTTVKTALNTAVSAYDATKEDYTEAELNTISSNLDNAISAANTSIANYKTLKTAIDDVTTKGATISSTAEAKATFDAVVTAATAGYNNATYDDAEAKSEVTALYDALRVYVKTQTATGSNYTLAIINPSFETGDMTGWTYVSESGVNDYGVRSTTNTTYKMTNSDGSYLFNTWWRGIPISQTITGLRNGHYTLTAVTSTDAGAITYLFANNCHVGITAVAGPSTGYEGTLDFSVTDGTAKIGVIGCSQNETWDETNYWYWYKVDNFRLTYQGEMQTVTLDEAADYTPASEFCNVTFIRSLKPNHWNTLCVPFSVANADIATVFGTGAQVANYTGVTLNDNNYTTLNFTTTDAKIEANKPCLIKITADPAPSSYALQNVTLTTDAVSNIAQTGTNTTLNKSVTATMIGTYSNITVPTTDAYVISNDKFYLVDGAVTLKAFRAYFLVPASNNGVKALNVNVDGQTTAVEGINADVQSISGNIYNLNGQLVRKNAATMNGLTKGVYIMNGKKMVVK